MRTFNKQLLFLLAIVAVFATGVLVIKAVGGIKIPTGYNQTGAGKPVAWWKMDEAGHNFQFLIFNF